MFEVYKALQAEVQAQIQSKNLNANEMYSDKDDEAMKTLIEEDFGAVALKDYDKIIEQPEFKTLTLKEYYLNLRCMLIVFNQKLSTLDGFLNDVVLKIDKKGDYHIPPYILGDRVHEKGWAHKDRDETNHYLVPSNYLQAENVALQGKKAKPISDLIVFLFPEDPDLEDARVTLNNWNKLSSSSSSANKADLLQEMYRLYSNVLLMLTNGKIENKKGQTPRQYVEACASSKEQYQPRFHAMKRLFDAHKVAPRIQDQLNQDSPKPVKKNLDFRRPWYRHPAVLGFGMMVFVSAAVCVGIGIATGNLESFKWLFHLSARAIWSIAASGVVAGMLTGLMAFVASARRDTNFVQPVGDFAYSIVPSTPSPPSSPVQTKSLETATPGYLVQMKNLVRRTPQSVEEHNGKLNQTVLEI